MSKRRKAKFSLKILRKLPSSVQRIYSVMRKGTWTHSSEIRRLAGSEGQSAEGGLRRMRELRVFFDIEKKRDRDGRSFKYRIVR